MESGCLVYTSLVEKFDNFLCPKLKCNFVQVLYLESKINADLGINVPSYILSYFGLISKIVHLNDYEQYEQSVMISTKNP